MVVMEHVKRPRRSFPDKYKAQTAELRRKLSR